MSEFQHVAGLSELTKTLKEFTPKLRRQALGAATRAAAAPIRDAAKQLAPIYHGDVAQGHPPPGTLKKEIIYKRIPEACTSLKEVYFVTVRRRKQKAYYWWWVEFGTHKMTANPYLRTAFRAKQQQAIDDFALVIRDGVQKIVLKGPG